MNNMKFQQTLKKISFHLSLFYVYVKIFILKYYPFKQRQLSMSVNVDNKK